MSDSVGWHPFRGLVTVKALTSGAFSGAGDVVDAPVGVGLKPGDRVLFRNGFLRPSDAVGRDGVLSAPDDYPHMVCAPSDVLFVWAGKVIPDANVADEVLNTRGSNSTWCRACDATFIVKGFPPKGRSTFTHCPFCGGTAENFT